jgi:hypothetical protein
MAHPKVKPKRRKKIEKWDPENKISKRIRYRERLKEFNKALHQEALELEYNEKYIQKSFSSEMAIQAEDLAFRSEPKGLFGWPWFKDNKKIQATLKRYPLLQPLIDYIDKQTRYITKDHYAKMAELNFKAFPGRFRKIKPSDDDYIHRSIYGKATFHSLFKVDKKWYAKTMKDLGFKTLSNLRRYMVKLQEIGFLKKAKKRIKRNYYYYDGHYSYRKERDKIQKWSHFKKATMKTPLEVFALFDGKSE